MKLSVSQLEKKVPWCVNFFFCTPSTVLAHFNLTSEIKRPLSPRFPSSQYQLKRTFTIWVAMLKNGDWALQDIIDYEHFGNWQMDVPPDYAKPG
jgi:hypothetical protein